MGNLVAGGVIAEGQVDMNGLLDRLRQETLSQSSQIESIPQVCAWTRV
jgi:hypothetical protein